uniref:Ubiquitin carboxyl-terminal hydrolase n=1 Tax=Chlamydomonas leiostraca TaxID=1034604 RepID=A0A7S0RD90_9CHLO|mmetsp:Transcript_19710/g.50075  ORF Transcript_19710/g.50075 Transcript_19710/m.50075 type:complete len:351 (+) Transcript_19710:75-1127(+)|eukprot:CAMPEP_0202882438 /NCGR_PEP_ID=MMETSP1391-20130828/37991_1 /ASSEMBLY_ACC=CAM_ASM_000867 /TAXON_ID=1034604 /ORGANISM="Chlamydomonas leiostraca, Strain SAG 11-49" /LENGTH=350 /DNA_ID=CAMNT_0049565293 /DNA_START=72 /DNA_END=1124 /DNA_ORIENTATION=+
MGRGDGSWTTIESDPGVFTELIEKIGVKGVQVEELWSMDKDTLLQMSPVYGLIFLFKWVAEDDKRPTADDTTGTVFFANQVIPNACATQAILSILLNIPPGAPGVELGEALTDFRAFTSDMPPDIKGLAISNSDVIRGVHNSFARPEPLVPDEDQKGGKDDDAFHFIAYVPVGGTLYELDGLKPGPVALASGLAGEHDWLERVGPEIQARIERYAASEIRFNLMALVGDQRARARAQLEVAQARKAAVEAALSGAPPPASPVPGDALPSDPSELQGLLVSLEDEIIRAGESLASENAKRERWRHENIRRRHNYIPLLFNMLKVFGESGKLDALIKAAKETQPAKRQRQRE